jgi:integrase
VAPPKKLPSGKWQVRVKDPLTGKWPARNFRTQAEAIRFQKECIADELTGRYVDPSAGKMTFDAFYQPWAARQVWEETTARNIAQSVRSSEFGPMRLGSITSVHAETWIKRMKTARLATSTIISRVRAVRTVLNAAIRDKKISEDPFVGVKLPKARKLAAAMEIPTPEEVGQLLAVADQKRTVMIWLAAFAGLRVGEVCAVQVGDIGFPFRTLKVRRQRQRREVRLPKSKSERTINLPDALVDLLKSYTATLPDVWLFKSDRRDSCIAESTMQGWWQAVRRDADLEDLNFHSLRHFYASGLIQAGCDVVTVQHAMGHHSATVTLNTYGHLWPDAADRTRAAAADLIQSCVQDPSDSDRTGKITQVSDQQE